MHEIELKVFLKWTQNEPKGPKGPKGSHKSKEF